MISCWKAIIFKAIPFILSISGFCTADIDCDKDLFSVVYCSSCCSGCFIAAAADTEVTFSWERNFLEKQRRQQMPAGVLLSYPAAGSLPFCCSRIR